jgi:hypothetical protein
MMISRLIISTTVTSTNKRNCNARATLQRSADGTPLKGVLVSGVWAQTNTAASANTIDTGIATLSLLDIKPSAPRSCNITVTSAALAGYRWDAAASITFAWISW